MTLSMLRRLALAGMVVVLVGGAPLTQIAEAAQDNSFEEDLPLANAGDPEAQNRLASFYSFGAGGAPQDYREAAVWRRKAAEQGHVRAQYLLGAAYRRGQGMPQDDVEAVAWWRKAAEQANVDAQYNLGVMYYNGTGVPQNDGEAYLWAGTVFFAGYDARYDQGNRLDTQLFSTSRFLRTNHAIFTKLQYLFRL